MREYTHRMQILSKVWHDLDLKCRLKHEVEVRTDLLAPYQTVLCYDLRNLVELNCNCIIEPKLLQLDGFKRCKVLNNLKDGLGVKE